MLSTFSVFGSINSLSIISEIDIIVASPIFDVHVMIITPNYWLRTKTIQINAIFKKR